MVRRTPASYTISLIELCRAALVDEPARRPICGAMYLMLLSMVVRAEDLVGRMGLVISSLVLAGSLVAWHVTHLLKCWTNQRQ